jgi:hypothetical protein
MNAQALQPDLGLVLAHARLYERLAESAIERRRSTPRSSLRTSIGRVATRIRLAFTQPAEATTTVPPLAGYPYQG